MKVSRPSCRCIGARRPLAGPALEGDIGRHQPEIDDGVQRHGKYVRARPASICVVRPAPWAGRCHEFDRDAAPVQAQSSAVAVIANIGSGTG